MFYYFFIFNQNNIGDVYNIKIIPDESILLPETISLNLYEINNRNSHSFSINESDEYIHMFTGTIINKSSKIKIEVKSESDTFTGTVSNLGKWEYFGKIGKIVTFFIGFLYVYVLKGPKSQYKSVTIWW